MINLNKIERIGIKRIIERGTAELLEQDDKGIFVRDTASGAYMISAENVNVGIEWLVKHEKKGYQLFLTCEKELKDFAFNKYNFAQGLDCYQFAYYGVEIPIHSKIIQARLGTPEDLPWICKYYDKISESELRQVILRNNLIIGIVNGQKIGFIGEHLEGSMGLLYVLPQFRNNGYATELEKRMINKTIKSGYVPFCQVEADNVKSLNLQKKLNMKRSENLIYWMWK